MKITSPKTKDEFKHYYQLRWEILRKPFGKPLGSEQDELEESSIHRMCVNNGKIIAIGRLQFNFQDEAQIRFMAVHPDFQHKGLGKKLVEEFEYISLENNRNTIILYARDYALKFYQKQGYEVVEKAHLLYGQLQHFLMRKEFYN